MVIELKSGNNYLKTNSFKAVKAFIEAQNGYMSINYVGSTFAQQLGLYHHKKLKRYVTDCTHIISFVLKITVKV